MQRKKEKGKTLTFRGKAWVDKACEHIVKEELANNNPITPPKEIDVHKAIYAAGIKPFFEKRGYPTTEEGWKEFLKQAIEDIE